MRVLYISYDGMTDPLGRSQVIPYLAGLAAKGHRIALLSFEKAQRYEMQGKDVAALLKDHRIEWHPLSYTAKPPVISTLWDVRKGQRAARALHAKGAFELIHCRSYIAALIGRWFLKIHRVPFLFDMRGFWADERVEGGLWNLKNPLYRMVYRYFKKKERQYFTESVHIVSLTDKGKEEILKMKLPGVDAEKISVIPCCTDMDLFTPVTDVTVRAARRQTLRIADNVTVISYLGSFGTWYMAEEMLDFIKVLKDQRPVVFLIISRDDPDQILASAQARGLKTDDVRIIAATREEVPPLLSLSDYTLFFIRPTFSKKASSPTKMGEALSMGIPVICNDGIGDCTEILMNGKAGIIVEAFTEAAFKNTADILQNSSAFDKAVVRAVASARFDLKKGVEKYHNIYAMIGSKTEGVRV